ncbi:MAG TPA: flagellar biosynthesis protein FlgJ, partial [Clostridia bacterium]|nr:flagellar biosynthesis protein FlgJ [Clostridia bacterium]
MLKRMRATIPKSGFIPESMATKMYEEMLDAEYSKTIAESPHHFGLADLLYEQLKPTIKGPNLE